MNTALELLIVQLLCTLQGSVRNIQANVCPQNEDCWNAFKEEKVPSMLRNSIYVVT
jgi:hypothetical protein